MRDSGQRWLVLSVFLVLLALFVPSVALPFGRDAWMRVSGAVVANHVSTHDFVGKPVSFLSVGGPRWVSWSEQRERAAAYHVLLLFPSASLTDNGGSSGVSDHRHTAVRSWRVETGGRAVDMRFEAQYDAVWRTVEIGDRRYSLSNGNVFVVRFGEGPQPSVAQIDTAIAVLGDGDALEGAVKSKLRGDEAVQRTLRDLRDYGDCASRQAPPLPSGKS